MGIEISCIYKAPARLEGTKIWYRCLIRSFFVSEEVGWAIGSAQVLRTENGGKSWQNFYKPNQNSPFSDISDLFPVSEDACWFTSMNPTLGSRYCFTSDAGKTWNEDLIGKDFVVKSVVFFNPRHGWLLGNRKTVGINGPLNIYFTNNGGQDWYFEQKNFSDRPVKYENNWLLGATFVRAENKMLSRLLHTKDSGKSWDPLPYFDAEIFDFQITRDEQIVAVGKEGAIFSSDSSGKEWEKLETGASGDLNAVNFLNRDLGMAVGDFGTVVVIKNGISESLEIFPDDNFLGVKLFEGNWGYLTSDKAIYRFTLTK
jgi:photosystem II stability/assembly factor-like uncharacterized protein